MTVAVAKKAVDQRPNVAEVYEWPKEEREFW